MFFPIINYNWWVSWYLSYMSVLSFLWILSFYYLLMRTLYSFIWINRNHIKMRESQLFMQISQPIVMVVACVSCSYRTLDLFLHVGTMEKNTSIDPESCCREWKHNKTNTLSLRCCKHYKCQHLFVALSESFIFFSF